MEVRAKKIKSITWKMITGIVIFLGINLLLLPDFLVRDPVVSIIQSAVSVFGWVMLINAASKLYEDNNSSAVGWLQIVAGVGLVGYCLFLIFWLIAVISPTQMMSDYISAVGGWSRKAHYGPAYNWCYKLQEYVGYFVIGLRALLCFTLVGTLNAAVRDEFKNYKRFKIVGVINIICIICIAGLIFGGFIYDEAIMVLIIAVYAIFLILYVFYMRRYLNISSERKNGSIFNRISEDEYQEFLNKMK